MSLLDTLADELAQKALALAEKTDDEEVVKRVGEVIGASSTTMEEAYLTAIRIRRAEGRALALLKELDPDG
ncbi:hypothetical protein ILP92_11535 [Maribius pontilimi]|uniref:Uncharacterized protein n=1 Tax=Palleronia pontilimi TaxID=1964209 RepID=A0A934IHX7_9RHOB|nr:hypothetical protein [Palleronia pontilimi]MBJ3763377.1 hypothetical protein [Palleronia pontilimi]